MVNQGRKMQRGGKGWLPSHPQLAEGHPRQGRLREGGRQTQRWSEPGGLEKDRVDKVGDQVGGGARAEGSGHTRPARTGVQWLDLKGCE